METQQLQHFLVIARLGNIGRAAAELNISQSGLSRSVRALEGELGLPLFEREPRGVSLTDFGQALRVRAQVIVAEHDRALAESRAFRALKSGDVVLGLHPVLARIGADEMIDRFLASYPAINLTVQVSADPEMTLRVATGEVDIAFALFTSERDPGLVYEDLLGLRCRIFHRPAYRLPPSRARLEDLAGEAWALGGGLTFRRTFEAAFVAAGSAPPARLLQCGSFALLLELVDRRDLLTVLPDPLVARLPAGRLDALDVAAPGGRPRGGLVYRAEIVQQPAIRTIAEHVRRLAMTLDAG